MACEPDFGRVENFLRVIVEYRRDTNAKEKRPVLILFRALKVSVMKFLIYNALLEVEVLQDCCSIFPSLTLTSGAMRKLECQ